MNSKTNLIYFNNNRTTVPDQAVSATMLETEKPGSPKEEIIKKAKLSLSHLLSAGPSELVFTSGTTDSITIALKSIAEVYAKKGKHIITSVTEHFAVLDCVKELAGSGAEITYLPVNREGLIDLQELRAALRPDTILVSIMAANNETGVIQPIEEIGALCEEKDILFFSDASQFAGKMRCDVKELGFSCMAFGAHKMYGPKGIGLLYIHEKHKELLNFIQKTYQSNVSSAQIAGFGKAADISSEEYWENSAHISKLKNYLEHQLLELEGLRIIGSTRSRLYNTSNLTFADPKKIIALKDKFAFADNLTNSSYVLKAMGLNEEEIKSSFRFSFGKYNTLDEVKMLVKELLH